MPLQGTFDTLGLPDVLHLLSGSAKTGTLRLDAGGVSGRIFLREGRCCGAEAGALTGAVEGETALRDRLVDACFTIARHPGGSFLFADAEQPPWPAPDDVAITEAVVELERVLAEWRDIQTVLPSLDARLVRCEELTVDSVTLDRQRWSLVVAADGRLRIRDLVDRAGGRTLEVCHALRHLVELGALGIVEEARPEEPEPAPAEPPARAALVAPVEPYGPGVGDLPDEHASPADAPEVPEVELPASEAPSPGTGEGDPAPVELPSLRGAAAEADLVGAGDEPGDDEVVVDEDDLPDRGALLRLFSALKET